MAGLIATFSLPYMMQGAISYFVFFALFFCICNNNNNNNNNNKKKKKNNNNNIIIFTETYLQKGVGHLSLYLLLTVALLTLFASHLLRMSGLGQ